MSAKKYAIWKEFTGQGYEHEAEKNPESSIPKKNGF